MAKGRITLEKLALMIAKEFTDVRAILNGHTRRFEDIDATLADHTQRLGRIETKQDAQQTMLDSHDRRLDRVEKH